MTRNILLGGKIRQFRQRRGWTQSALAARLDLSASYLNLLENNKRGVTVPVLLKLAKTFKVDLDSFAANDEARLTAELKEAFSDAVFEGQPLNSADIVNLAHQAPLAARAVLDLYRAYRSVRDDAQALATQVSAGAERGQVEHYSLPSEEVSDLLEERNNHFPELEEAATELWKSARLSNSDLQARLTRHLEETFDVRIDVVPSKEIDGAARIFDTSKKKLRVSETLPFSSHVFQLAHQIGLLTLDSLFMSRIEHADLSTEDSRALAKVALANYFAGAVMMPYDRFLEAAVDARYDLEILKHRFSASFEQVAHRLTTLNRPGNSGVPFHFVRIDIAGNVSKKFSGSGIPFSRYGGACPRWNIHAAFATPNSIRVQFSRMPDGNAYLCIARGIQKGGGGHRTPQTQLAIGLGCHVEHAQELVYSDGIDLSNLDAAVPIGISCRICERMDCLQRAFPPLRQQLDIDINRRGLTFYQGVNQATPPTTEPPADS